MTTITIPVKLAQNIMDDLVEFRGQNAWWKDESRCGYSIRHKNLCDEIDQLEKVIYEACTLPLD